MQFGDLAEYDRETLILVLEGMLANVVKIEHVSGFIRKHATTTYHINWYEVPLKRMIVMKERFPQYEISIVTFMGTDVADQAADYLNTFSIPYDGIKAWDYEIFCSWVRFAHHLRAVYDTDQQRLEGYGQYGVGSLAGHDW